MIQASNSPKQISAALWLAFLISIACLPQAAHADGGPHPRVEIDVFYKGHALPDSIFYARLLERSADSRIESFLQDTSGDRTIDSCLALFIYDSTQACYWKPAGLVSGGRGYFSGLFFDYYPPSEFRISIYAPSLKKLIVSNEVERAHYSGTFRLDISSDGKAALTETTQLLNLHDLITFFIALLITVPLELMVAALYCSRKKLPKAKVLPSVVTANFISMPVVWFVFPILRPILLVISLSEIFAVLFEAYFIHSLNRTLLSFRQSFFLSMLMNMTSFLIGGVIFVLVADFFVGIRLR